MQANIALGLLETASIAKGIEASDAMCKMASVELFKTHVLARGKYVVLISGPVGEVESSLRAGVEIAKDSVIHHFIIRNVHQQVLDSLDRRVPVPALDAVGVIETKEAISAVGAADAAAKAARVHLLETKLAVGGGKGYVSMTGEVGAVRSAMAAGIAAVPEGLRVGHIILTQADPQLLASIGK